MPWQDHMSDTHVAAPHEGRVSPSGNVTPDPGDEEPGKLIWRPCPRCNAEGEGFRLVCLNYRDRYVNPALVPHRQACGMCLRDLRDSAERASFRMHSGEVEKAADALLRKAGVKLAWKRGGKQIKIP